MIRKACVTLSVVAVCFTASKALAQEPLSDGDFDALDVGTNPDCGNNAGAGAWFFGTTYTQPGVCEASPQQLTVVATDSFDPGAQGNSLHLLIVADPTTNAHLPNRFNFALPEGDPVTVTFDIWVAAGGGGGSVYVGADNGGGGFSNATDRGPQMSWMTNGTIGVNEGGVNNTVVQSYPADAWHSVRMEIDMVTDTFDLFWGPRGGPLDQVGNDLRYRSGPMTRLDRFTFVNFGGLMANVDSYLDNVTVRVGVCVPCDMNCDGDINALDIEFFIDLLFNGTEPCCGSRGDIGSTGDVNLDGSIDAADIEGFIACLFP